MLLKKNHYKNNFKVLNTKYRDLKDFKFINSNFYNIFKRWAHIPISQMKNWSKFPEYVANRQNEDFQPTWSKLRGSAFQLYPISNYYVIKIMEIFHSKLKAKSFI